MLEAHEAYESAVELSKLIGETLPPWEALSNQEKDGWQVLADEVNEADYAKS